MAHQAHALAKNLLEIKAYTGKEIVLRGKNVGTVFPCKRRSLVCRKGHETQLHVLTVASKLLLLVISITTGKLHSSRMYLVVSLAEAIHPWYNIAAANPSTTVSFHGPPNTRIDIGGVIFREIAIRYPQLKQCKEFPVFPLESIL